MEPPDGKRFTLLQPNDVLPSNGKNLLPDRGGPGDRDQSGTRSSGLTLSAGESPDADSDSPDEHPTDDEPSSREPDLVSKFSTATDSLFRKLYFDFLFAILEEHIHGLLATFISAVFG